MIRIPPDLASKMTVLVGFESEAISNAPRVIFDESRIEFLSSLSRRLMNDPQVRQLPDIVTFAYWCRRANLERLRSRYLSNDKLQVGVGLTFHICPNNVPVNFAFSMAFGLLSGNTCLLRLPSGESESIDLLVEAIQRELVSRDYHEVIEDLTVVRYNRDDALTAYLMSIADGRVIWGGDETVSQMRAMPSRARSREVAFPDRFSLCVLEPRSILEMSAEDLLRFCRNLYNDIYLMDQAACSSPQAFVWIGDEDYTLKAKARLWPLVVRIAEERYKIEAVSVMDKFLQVCRIASGNQNTLSIERHANTLYRVELDSLDDHQDKWRGYFGTIYEVRLNQLDELAEFVNERFQTLTTYGIENSVMEEFISQHRLRGIDRVVPVGHALDMDVFWDGYDIIGSLSRIVEIN